MRIRDVALALITSWSFGAVCAVAGGPTVVGGPPVGTRPAFGIDGKPFTWNPAKMPISYRVDPGPMAISPSGVVVIDHAAGVQRVQSMFAVWQEVPTASLSFSNIGNLLPTGRYTGGDLTTAQQFNDVIGSCKSGIQNPIIFDANGTLIASLGLPPEVIGFNSGCALDTTNGFLLGSAIVLNGKFQDGVDTPRSSPPDFEITANEFDEAIMHEMGHFSGLGHSQINLDLLLSGASPCDPDSLAGLPLMFPVEFCQARKDAGLPVLAPDDVSWISSLYPSATTVNNYGTISGSIFFGDGVTPVQGVNVIARLIDNPNTPEDESRRVAVSAVSGYLFTGNPGQSVTASMGSASENNTNGSPAGSRNPALIGFYQIAVPPGTYTVEVESVYSNFVGGSGVGPLNPPAPMPGQPEFWNKQESAFDFPLQRDTITVHAGDNITGIDIILNSPIPRYDQFEDEGRLFRVPLMNRMLLPKDMAA
ncbi:MAG TPA: hypothetical protein VJN64_02395 [Terriglobales bacterium]|nr:hypothetical protein [Terriglobales bacterium]